LPLAAHPSFSCGALNADAVGTYVQTAKIPSADDARPSRRGRAYSAYAENFHICKSISQIKTIALPQLPAFS